MIRPLTPQDYPEIERMISESKHMYPMDFVKENNTFVLDDEPKGFFTYLVHKGIPVLQHFYVDPKYRSIGNARKLIRGFLETVKGSGHCIISAQEEPQLVEYFFKKKPDHISGKHQLFTIEV